MTQSATLAAVPGGTGLSVRQGMNLSLECILTNNSGESEPSPVYENMGWYKPSTRTTYQRNDSNTAWLIYSNYTFSGVPGSGDDDADGYTIGSEIFDTSGKNFFRCVDASTGAAIWRQSTAPLATNQELSDGVITTARYVTPKQVADYGGGGGGTTNFYLPNVIGGSTNAAATPASLVPVTYRDRAVIIGPHQGKPDGSAVFEFPGAPGKTVRFVSGLSSGAHLSGYCITAATANVDIDVDYWNGSSWADAGTIRYAAGAYVPTVQSWSSDVDAVDAKLKFTFPSQDATFADFAFSIMGEIQG